MEGDTENADDADESSVSGNNAINKYFDIIVLFQNNVRYTFFLLYKQLYFRVQSQFAFCPFWTMTML